MAETDTFLATPTPEDHAATGIEMHSWRRLSVAALTLGELSSLLPDWRALAAVSLDDNPFLAPAFVMTAARHSGEAGPPMFAVVWDEQQGVRRLVGLFPLRPAKRRRAATVFGTFRSELYRHEMQPLSGPLIAGPEEGAAAIVSAFFDWLLARRPALASLEAAALAPMSVGGSLMLAEAAHRGMSVERRRDAPRTRGLDFVPGKPLPTTSGVRVANQAHDLRAALEDLFCFDSAASGLGKHDRVLDDPGRATFLRSVVRSLALEGRVLIATIDHEGLQAGSAFVVGRSRAFMWWLTGRSCDNPMVQASLAAAAADALGKPIVAASARPLCGLCTEPLVTESVSIGLSPQASQIAARVRLRMAAGILGLG